MSEAQDLNKTLFSGLADVYNAYRPQPPDILVDILTRRAGMQRPSLVVDVGCGTGHSTFLWAEQAEHVIGIEPNDDMRRVAQQRRAILTNTSHVAFSEASAADTDLPDACADIVTFSQSLHHMVPQPTLAEVERILRPGGVVAAYDYQFPPLTEWKAEAAITSFFDKVHALSQTLQPEIGLQWWSKEEHAERMEASGHFRHVAQFWVHNVELGNATRLIGLVESLGTLRTLLERGHTAGDLGLEAFKDRIRAMLGEEMQPWTFSYRVVTALK